MLVSILATSTIVSSTAGEALVLHQHGAHRAHLHVLGLNEILSNAAWSPGFGHTRNSNRTTQLTSEQVRIIAFVTIGSVFVSKRTGTSAADARRLTPLDFTLFLVFETQEPTVSSTGRFSFPIRIAPTATATLLLRNHSILI